MAFEPKSLSFREIKKLLPPFSSGNSFANGRNIATPPFNIYFRKPLFSQTPCAPPRALGKYVAFWKIFQNIFSFLKKVHDQRKNGNNFTLS